MNVSNEEQLAPHELAFHLQPNGALLLDRKSMFYFRLSGKAAQLALLLAKNSSIERAARIWEMVSQEKTDTESLSRELDAHPFTALWKDGLLDKPLPISGSIDAFLPISCTLQLTNACNLNCSFCYASSGKPYPDELSAQQWIEVMQKLAASGVADVTLTGGEAKLAKQFERIVTTASTLFTNVNLFSNGLNWRDREIELIRNLGNVYVQVSIDGRSATHDRLRGREGSFRESMDNVRRLTDAAIPVLIAMTVNHMNFLDIENVIDSAAEVGASVFRAGKTLSVGRADDHAFALNGEQEHAVKSQLRSAKEKWGSSLFIPDWDGDDSNGCTDFCTPGYLAWYIRADGVVTPCQIEEMPLGHILKDSLATIGSPARLWEVKCSAKHCNCIGKVELAEKDLPFCPPTEVLL